MKEKVFDLIVTILSNFSVSFETWREFEREINNLYITGVEKSVIKK